MLGLILLVPEPESDELEYLIVIEVAPVLEHLESQVRNADELLLQVGRVADLRDHELDGHV